MIRFFDVLFSCLGVLILSPLLLMVSIILKFTGEGDVFYLQDRVGINHKTFKLYKFATMLRKSPSLGTGDITLENDPRVLPFGKILRKLKINELPQLFNVLKGDMSLVGPRPLTQKIHDLYPKEIRDLIVRNRPGLTGMGSIFFHNEEKITFGEQDPIKFYIEYIVPYKAELELWYYNNRSLRIYFKIILLTFLIVIGFKFTIKLINGNLPHPDKKILSKIFFNK